MKITFFNSAKLQARECLLIKGGALRHVELKVRFGIIEHPDHGVILIDGGYGPDLWMSSATLALRIYRSVLQPKLNDCLTPRAALAALGYTPADVGTIILTHLHADHVCGLGGPGDPAANNFPNARVFLGSEARAALRQPLVHRLRSGIFAELVPHTLVDRAVPFETLPVTAAHGCTGLRDIFGDGSLLATPLPGHAAGHHGLICQTEKGPLLYGCDVAWLPSTVYQLRPPGFPVSMIGTSHAASERSLTQAWLWSRAGGDMVLCHAPHATPYDWRGQPS